MNTLGMIDPEIAAAVQDELDRQALTIELNAATNTPSLAVIEAQGNVFAHKTLEGYPGGRYHGGYRNVDVIERLAVERAKGLFQADHANVQPHCGVNANLAVYFATLETGDDILGMDLATGGHLSHGHRASFSGRFFKPHYYGVDPVTETLDYDGMRRTALRKRPRMIICGASAYPRLIDFKIFREVADEVGAYMLADIAHVAGLVAGEVYPSPVPYADFVTFTGYKTLRGSRGGNILCREEFARKIDGAVFPGVQGSMHVHLMAAKAVTFRMASTGAFKTYSRQIVSNAKTLAAGLRDLGYRIVCGDTDTHLVLVDLRKKELTGAEAQDLLENAGIICNKNRIPFDPLGAEKTSGIRIGTSAVTSRGFKEQEMTRLADMIDRVLSGTGAERGKVKRDVERLCMRFPLLSDPFGMEAACMDKGGIFHGGSESHGKE